MSGFGDIFVLSAFKFTVSNDIQIDCSVSVLPYSLEYIQRTT